MSLVNKRSIARPVCEQRSAHKDEIEFLLSRAYGVRSGLLWWMARTVQAVVAALRIVPWPRLDRPWVSPAPGRERARSRHIL